MSAHLKIEFLGGGTIENACYEAIRIANMLFVTVNFVFNGVLVMAKPGACPQELADEWDRELQSDHKHKVATVHPSKYGAQKEQEK